MFQAKSHAIREKSIDTISQINRNLYFRNLMVSYYKVLQIPENATQEEIKSSYYRLAMEYHPDRNPDNPLAEEYFKRINEAYQVLRDPVKRQWYNLMQQGNIFSQTLDRRKYGTSRGPDPNRRKQREDSFEDDDKRPFWLRVTFPGLTMIWGLLLIYNNWFITSKGLETAKVFFGIMLFLIASYFFVNNLYIYWLKKQSEGKLKFNPEQRSLVTYILLLFLTIPFFWGIGVVRKSWHLNHYGRITKAEVTELKSYGDDYQAEIIYFDEDNKAYTKRIEFAFPFDLHINRTEIYMKYSTREPRITLYSIKLTDTDSILQPFVDEANKDNDYFSMQN